MEKRPEISVIIPTYSRVWELSQAIESVLNQTYSNFELILVDNNSKSETREICTGYLSRYPEKIRIIHEPDQGVCSARNTAIKESRGHFIALLDEDDVMKPDRLDSQINLFKNQPGLSLVTSSYDIISPDGTTVLREGVSTPSFNSPITFYLIEKAIIKLFESIVSKEYASSFHFHVPSSYFFPKETAIRAGLFDKRFNPQFLEDYEFQVRMFSEGPFAHIPKPLFQFRESDWKLNRESYDIQPKKYQVRSDWHRNDEIFFKTLWNNFHSVSNKNVQILKNIHSILLRSVGLNAIRYQDGKDIGRRLLMRAFLADPFDPLNLKFFCKSLFPRTLHPRLFWFNQYQPGTLENIPSDFSKVLLCWPPESSTES